MDNKKNNEIAEAILEKGQQPIGDGHDSERIWHNGRYIEYYRKVMADAIGIDPDKIPDNMYIHHIDGDRMNNDIDNLMLCTKKAHENLEMILDPHHYDPE